MALVAGLVPSGEEEDLPLPRDLYSEVSGPGESARPLGSLRWSGSSDPWWGEEQDPAPQAPPEKEHFDPPHGSWAGAANHFSGDAWKNYVWDDYLATPAVLLPLGLGVSAAVISHWDKTIQAHWVGVLGAKDSTYSDAGQYILLGSSILLGLFLPGEGRNWWDEAWTIGEALGMASLTSLVLKTAVNRARPGMTPGTTDGTRSFPSGHATLAFTSAALIERNNGLAVGLPAYGLAAFTGFERVEEGFHWPSDVLAGAAVGVLWASLVDHLHWGSEGKGGIARPPVDLKVGFVDGLHGFDLELLVRF
jgi:membrane-associated phospholipid phosphatase